MPLPPLVLTGDELLSVLLAARSSAATLSEGGARRVVTMAGSCWVALRCISITKSRSVRRVVPPAGEPALLLVAALSPRRRRPPQKR